MFSRSITNILSKPSAHAGFGQLRFKATTTAGLSAQSLKIRKADVLKPLVPAKDLVFGSTFTDHMLTVDWKEGEGWKAPEIRPFDKLEFYPSAVVFHYALTCFEGMKAYKGKDGKIRLFRPDMNMKRMNNSVARIALPTFDGDELTKLIGEYLKLDERWIPDERGYSLYLRPTCIGTQETLGVNPSSTAMLFVIGCPVGPYYKTGFAAVSLKATTEFVRAWPRGTGSSKIGANYAAGILPQQLAAKDGYQQNLWLFGEQHELTEVGTMNLFLLMKNEKGEKELVTPPLDGSILPGVTRDSIISLAREWEPETGIKVVEKKMTMPQLRDAIKDNRMVEIFGAGTACIVSPVKCISYEGEDLQIPLDPENPKEQAGPFTRRLNKTILDIQYGEVEHPWSVVVN